MQPTGKRRVPGSGDYFIGIIISIDKTVKKEVINLAKLKKGQRLVCEPCGREIVVDACGCSESGVWCCNQPMAGKAKSKAKKK